MFYIRRSNYNKNLYEIMEAPSGKTTVRDRKIYGNLTFELAQRTLSNMPNTLFKAAS